MSTPAALPRLLAALTDAVDAAPDPAAAVRAVVAVIRPVLGRPDLLPPDAEDPGPDGARETLLHADPAGRFSLVALAWAPGQRTPPHDHLAWGVVGVHRGAETETRYRLDPVAERLVVVARTHAGVGDVEGFVPPEDVHVVAVAGEQIAVSLHVYGADLSRTGSSVRRVHALPPS